MRLWGKLAVAAALPLTLSSCLWGPGKFTSDLALNRKGTFVLDYRGEILLQMPEKEPAPEPWSSKKVRCYANGNVDIVDADTSVDGAAGVGEEAEGNSRPCTTAEIERERAKYEKEEADRVARKRTENEQMAKLFGIPGSDDESNRRFASSLMKHKGWRSVTYKGKGRFEVDYHFEGRLDQDFAFPIMPDTDLLIPFITIRPRTDGSVKVTAPALVGGGGIFAARAKSMGLPDKGEGGPPSRAEGRFTITTDGEILTNNSEDGPTPSPGGRKVQWEVGPGSQKVPELLVKL